MKAVESIRKAVPFLRGKPTLTRRDAMAIMPIRNSVVEWSKCDGEITLQVPLRKDRLARVIERFIKVPDRKQVVLDEVGSTVWEMCDGEHDIAQIVNQICSLYRLSRREAEASVTAFFKLLAQKKLIGLVQRRPGSAEKSGKDSKK